MLLGSIVVKRGWILWMFVAWACAWQACAAPRPIAPLVFRVYGTEQGLPSRQVQALAEDALGRLWVGTGTGLVRFDGHRFVAYPARLEQPNALASISVEAMLIAADGRLWVATQGGHLALRREASDDFERIELQTLLGAAQLEIWSLASGGDRVWAGTYGAGLLELGLDGQLRRALPLADPAPQLTDVLAAADGALWLLTMEQQLLRFDPATGVASPLALEPGEPAPEVYGTAMTDAGLWFSTRDGRLCSVAADRVPACAAIPLLVNAGRARMLLPNARGDWIGGFGELVRVIDGQPHRVAFEPGSIGGLPQNPLWTAISDRDGGLWLGSAGGGLLHLGGDADRFQVWQPSAAGRGGLRDGRVRGVTTGDDGKIYLATLNAGLHRLDPHTGEIAALDLPGTRQRRVWAVLGADGGQLWVGYQDGLMQLAVLATGELQLQRQWTAQLVGPMIDLLHRDDDGRIWAASMGAGVNRIDPDSGKVEQFAFAAEGLVGTEVQQIGRGIDGRTWAATDNGMHAFEPACGCWRTLIAGGRVESWAAVDPQRIDAFVDHQLVRYRWRDGLYRDEATAPRAFAEFQTVGGMLRHGDDLWLAGPQGLFRYSAVTGRLGVLGARDGLPTQEFSDRPMHADAHGRLWIGSEDGLISTDPGQKVVLPSPPRLRFDRLQVNGPDGLRDLPTIGSALLMPHDRDLQVVVRLTSLARPHAQRFSFRVAGWDPDWSAPSTQSERRIETLPSGRYKFEVRAWDGHGQAAANTLSWPFEVLPPWWRSMPALAAYGLLLALLAAALEAWRRRRQRMAELWQETRRQAEWAERLATEKSALVAELSHEIRNPLNGVLGMGRLLSGQPLSIDGQRYLGLLQDAGRQLTRLLDDMLDWTRLESRSTRLPLQPVPLQRTLGATLERHARQAREGGLAFTADLGAGLVALADTSRLQQIVDNLVNNAIKFTAAGSISVHARALADRVEIRVRDSGPGMSPEQVARLFRPFERVGDERAAPGTGLGLAISRRLAERMGGDLRVESQPGAGSCFVLTLAAAPTNACIEAVADAHDAAPGHALASSCLLVVEDDAIARELLARELGARGAVVHSVPEALSALIVVQQQRFDAALIDWDLPGMHGVDLARTLRAQQPTLPLIAVTGRATPADQALAIEAGFVAHVAKPVDPDRLAAMLQEVLTRQRHAPASVGPDLSGRS